jgi:hypothetical protein
MAIPINGDLSGLPSKDAKYSDSHGRVFEVVEIDQGNCCKGSSNEATIAEKKRTTKLGP